MCCKRKERIRRSIHVSKHIHWLLSDTFLVCRCRGLVCTSGQHMKCSNVVTTSQLVRRALDTSHFTNTVKISRAILLTDRPLYQGESKGVRVTTAILHSTFVYSFLRYSVCVKYTLYICISMFWSWGGSMYITCT